jgi:hypothetical protein
MNPRNAVILKGVLYCGAALLTPLASLMSEGAKANAWPAGVAIAAAAMTGLVQALLTARAYTDGGVERLKEVTP